MGKTVFKKNIGRDPESWTYPNSNLFSLYFYVSDESETSPPPNVSDKEFRETNEFQRSVEILQLLFLLIPDANYNLLKDMLSFLNRITLHQSKNKMSASNLGTIFATHLICPRKLSAESLQSNHQLYASAATFMIERADVLFNIPRKVVQDVLAYGDKRPNKGNKMGNG